MRKIHLLGIDCQNDFADPKGSLFVDGADKDMESLAKFIVRVGNRIDRIHMTIDSHHAFQIFHPSFWIDSNNEHPNPFTIISVDDVVSKRWSTAIKDLQSKGEEYIKNLENKGRYPLIIWPYHTIVGSWGYSIYPSVSDAIIKWEKETKKTVNYCPKGDFYLSEHYGAFEAEVPSLEDPNTMLNKPFLETLKEADELLISGEALSHCVKSTVEQIADNLGEDYIKKFIFLEDTSSSVNGFEKNGIDFINAMVNRGMKVIKSTDYV